MKGNLYFPKLLFHNVKSVEKQISYGGRSTEYYWMAKNYEKYDFEYFEIFQVTAYCEFDFSKFPFDDHKCGLMVGSGIGPQSLLRVSKPTIIYKEYKSKEDFISIESKNVPLKMKAKSITPFFIEMNGYNYSYSGVNIFFERHKLGLLISGFYGPTSIISALSILSYNIDIEKVILCINCLSDNSAIFYVEVRFEIILRFLDVWACSLFCILFLLMCTIQ